MLGYPLMVIDDMKFTKALNKVLDYIEHPIGWIGRILLLFAVTICVVSVIGRLIFHWSPAYIDELALYPAIWSAFILIGVVHRGIGHISIDYFLNKFRGWNGDIARLVLELVTLLMCIIFAYWGFGMVHKFWVMGYETPSELRLPYSILFAALPLGMAFCGLASLEKVFKHIYSLCSSSKESGE